MTRLRLFLILVLLTIVGFAAAGSAYVWFKQAVVANGPLANPTTIVIAPGSSLPVMGRQLAEAGVVERPWLFELEARRLGQARLLKAGEYRFDPGISIDAAITKIVRREVVVHFVTIPEGLVTADVRAILKDAEFLSGEVPANIVDGELLPETYRYERGDTREGIVARMRAARTTVVAELWNTRAQDLPLRTAEEAVVLASIVEKETGVTGERPRVAAVFINRLKRGMKLQSDPTVIYGLAPDTGTLDRPLRKADLESATAYNTYVIGALPPGPICNPGRAALAAVMAPASSNDLYFVADGTGGHAFAATLDEHNRNVARWRQIQNHSP